MPLPACGTVAGLPLNVQIAGIYCALREGVADPTGLPTCDCVAGRPITGMLQAILCLLTGETSCTCAASINSLLDAIYCAAFENADSPVGLVSCACVRGRTINGKVDAIYCVFYVQAGSPADLPTCACVAGLPLNQKLNAIYLAIVADESPTNLATLHVAWDASSGAPDGYRVEYSVNGVNWTVAGEVPADVLEFTITDLLWDTPYYTRVFAFNGGGDSPASNVLLLWTATEFGPTNLVATTIDDQSILVDYLDSVTQPSNGGYKVRWKETSAPAYATNDFVLGAIGEQQVSVSGLDPDTSYDFKAVTYNDNSTNIPPQVDSESVPSNVDSATTTPEQVVPTLVSLTIPSTANTLVMVLSENCVFGTGGNGGLTLSSSGGAVTVSYVSGAGTNTLTYSTSRAIAFGEVITATYVQPVNGIQDLAGNDLESFAAQAVTNSVPAPYAQFFDFEGVGTPAGLVPTGTVDLAYTTSPLAGSKSCAITGSGSNIEITFSGGAKNEYWIVLLFRTAGIAGSQRTWMVTSDPSNEAFAYFSGATVRDVSIQDAGGARQSTTAAISNGTVYYCWYHHTKGVASVSEIFWSTTPTRPLRTDFAHYAVCAGTSNNAISKFKISGNDDGVFVVDNIGISNTEIGDNPF